MKHNEESGSEDARVAAQGPPGKLPEEAGTESAAPAGAGAAKVPSAYQTVKEALKNSRHE